MWAQQGVRCHCFYITNVDPASHRRRLARFLPRAILDRAPAGVRSPRVGVKLLIKELERARDFGSGSFLLLISAAFPFKMPPLPPGPPCSLPLSTLVGSVGDGLALLSPPCSGGGQALSFSSGVSSQDQHRAPETRRRVTNQASLERR